MKIALGVGYYYPDSIGGTEKYVHDLATYLVSQNIEVSIIAPSSSEDCKATGNYSYQNNDVKGKEYTVYRFEVPKELSHEEITDKVICRGWQNFEELLNKLKPDIFHLHTLSTTLNYRHLKIAKEKGIKTLFTAHIPGIICPKGDFIQYPNKVCNGKLHNSTCGYCYAQQRHKNKIVAEVTGTLAKSNFVSSLLEKKIPQFSIVSQKKNTLQELEENTNHIIAVCQWLYNAFLINNVSPNHLKICRQGVSTSYLESQIKTESVELQDDSHNIKIGFIGRLEPIKGLHILLDAYEKVVRENTDIKLELHIVAVKQELHLDYYKQLQEQIKSLPNIIYQESLPAEKVSLFMAKLDYLCIPSTWLETGPIVAYEAFANQIPIIGANIGGLAELVEDNKTGFLYAHNNNNGLKNILLKVAHQTELVRKLKRNLQAPRTTKEVGREMVKIYLSL
ncbi:glycosyltransferase [Bernardetia sp. MNP-M8]|uniref:glycosyltransferase n=1 Tax=Bernardetia sp. MNP-M8 TaxID=3127470 RepID=UPI0030D493C7